MIEPVPITESLQIRSEPDADPGFADALAPLTALRPSAVSPVLAPLPTRALPPDPPPPLADLADAVLLCAFLRRVMPNCPDPDALAERALARFGSFAALLAAPVRELRGVGGFGQHSLSAIKLLHEAALRLARARLHDRPILADRAELLDYLAAVLSRERIEQFRILFLDAEDRLLLDEAQARGTVNHTPVYPREVLRRAMELEAAGIVLVHNHPSGDPTPSQEDLAMTRQIVEACAVMGVAVRDHLIVGNGRTASFRDQGLLS
ncbi:MAG: DNA repair protein RadC [Gluconacetobacter diazotrophicus]|nr:DNA repair protein RadC [Gluconacetobacter diazotrophicus]